jgi:hypothetical protein
MRNEFAQYTIPELSPDAALERQYLNTQRPPEFARDQVASTAKGENPDNPAKIGDQFFEVVTQDGRGKLPLVASRPIGHEIYEDIRVIYKVTHGELANVWDYYYNFMAALGPMFDPDKVLIVAPQFPRPVDPIDDDTFRWETNGWRSGEPAVYPSDPVGSYDAEDQLDYHLAKICPNAVVIRERYNSEGSQKGDRRLRWSQALLDFELAGKTVEGRIQNAGSYQYDNSWRPLLLNPGDSHKKWEYEWHIPEDPLVDRWPLGMFDPRHPDFAMFGPPPSVLRFILRHSVEVGNAAYLRRGRISIAVGDHDPDGSRVPKGVGFDEQGATRLERAYARWEHAIKYSGHLLTNGFGLQVVGGMRHSAIDNFIILEVADTMMKWPACDST